MCIKQEHQEHKSRNYLLKKKKKPKLKILSESNLNSLSSVSFFPSFLLSCSFRFFSSSFLSTKNIAKQLNIQISHTQRANFSRFQGFVFSISSILEREWRERAMEECCTTRYKSRSCAPCIASTRCSRDLSSPNSIWPRSPPISIARSAR